MNEKRASAKDSRRRIRYIDGALQKWLVVVVVLEVAAVMVTVGLLYWRLSGLIEDNLFRVHFPGPSSMVYALFHEGAILLLGFIAVNVIALLVAAVIWGRYVGGIMHDFVVVIERTLGMDFSADGEREHRHEVLALADQWRKKERERLAAINEQVASLEAGSGTAGRLRRLQELLR